jgi:hypothetical protein
MVAPIIIRAQKQLNNTSSSSTVDLDLNENQFQLSIHPECDPLSNLHKKTVVQYKNDKN